LVVRGQLGEQPHPHQATTVELRDGTGRVWRAVQADAALAYELKLPEELLDGLSRHLAVHVVGWRGAEISLPLSLSSTGMGLVERIDQDHISGWAVSLETSDYTADVVALVEGRVVGRARADGFCAPLTHWLQGSGFHGFHVPLDRPLSDAERAVLEVRIRGAELGLASAPDAVAVLESAPAASQSLSSRFDAGLDEIRSEGVSGWLRDLEGRGEDLSLGLYIDGELVEAVRPDGWREDRGRCGFWVAFPPGLDLTKEHNISLRLPQGNMALPELTRRWAAPAIGWSHIRLDPGGVGTSGPTPLPLPLSQEDATAAVTVAIIVLNRDGAKHLEALFASFATHNLHPHYRFIILDHGSRDGSVALCQQWMAQLNIDLYCRGQNYSFSQSNNYGASLAEEDVVFFLNNDIILDRCVLTPLLRCLGEDSVGIVGLKLVTPMEGAEGELTPGFVQHLGVKFGTRPDRPPISPYELPLTEETRAISESSWEVPAVTAAALALRRVDFETVGGFDEAYFYGYEDVDFCLAARRRLNKRIICANHIQAYHKRGATRTAQDPVTRRRYVLNQDVLAARFGAYLRQSTRQDLVPGRQFWRQVPLRIAFVVSAVEPAQPARDFNVAFELGRALVFGLGWQVSYLAPEDWYALDGFDVVVVMAADWLPNHSVSGNATLTLVAWTYDRVEQWLDHLWLRHFDMIWAGSDRAQQAFSGRVSLPVIVMRPMVDPERFTPNPAETGRLSEYCFIGDFHHQPGQLVPQLDAAALPYRFALYGKNWSDIAWLEPYYRGAVTQEMRPAVYAGSLLVLDDATECERRWGGLGSDVFEALAAGALVISRNLRGAQEVFGDRLPVCRNSADLQGVIRYYMDNPQERQALAAELRSVVLTDHSSQVRAKAVAGALQGMFGALRFSVRCLSSAGQQAKGTPWGIGQLLTDQLRQQGAWVRLLDPSATLPQTMLLGDDVVLHVSTDPAVDPAVLRPDQVHLRLHFGAAADLSETEAGRYDGLLLASDTEAEALRGGRGPVLTLFANRSEQQDCYQVDRASGELHYGDARQMLAALQRQLPRLEALARRLDRGKYRQDRLGRRAAPVAAGPVDGAARPAPLQQQIEIGAGGALRRCRVAAPVQTAAGRVAAVVLHYQHVEDTQRCVLALLQQSYTEQHIYIVSNDEDDEAFDLFVDQFPLCTVIQSPGNLGYAGGNNIALSLARAQGFDLMWVVNPDTVAPPDYLQQMVTLADLHPEISILGSTIVYGHQPDRVWFGGGFVQWDEGLDVRHGHIGRRIDHLPDRPIPCDYVTGASLILRSSLLQGVGYFPEDHFLYFEETRWCLEAAAQGHRIVTFPQVALAHHKRSEEGGAPTPVFLYYYVRNALILCRDQHPDKLEQTRARLGQFTEMLLSKVAAHVPERLAASTSAVAAGFRDGDAGVTGKMNPAHYAGGIENCASEEHGPLV